MANDVYQKHNWQSNELIREESLNHMEEGIYQAYNKAKQTAADILNSQEELTNIIQQMITNYSFSIDENNHTLKFNIN